MAKIEERTEQIVNDIIKEECHQIFIYASVHYHARVKQLYKCNARLFYNENYPHYIFLESYSTTVAFYDIEENILFIRGRYSNTTYQHIAKFKKWIFENYNPIDRFGYHVIDTYDLKLEDNWNCYS